MQEVHPRLVAEHRVGTHLEAVRATVAHPDELPLLAAAGDLLSAVYVLTRVYREDDRDGYDAVAQSTDGGRTVNGLVHLRGQYEHAKVAVHSSIEMVWPSSWYAFWGAWLWTADAPAGGPMGEDYLNHVAGREVSMTCRVAERWLLEELPSEL